MALRDCRKSEQAMCLVVMPWWRRFYPDINAVSKSKAARQTLHSRVVPTRDRRTRRYDVTDEITCHVIRFLFEFVPGHGPDFFSPHGI